MMISLDGFTLKIKIFRKRARIAYYYYLNYLYCIAFLIRNG